MSQAKAFLLIIALLVLAGVAGAILRKGTGLKSPALLGEASTTTQVQTPTSTPPQAAVITAPAAAPSLSGAVNGSADLSPAVKGAVDERIAALRAALAKNSGDYSGWMNLALQYKAAGDYAAAREVWEYISRAYPTRATALHNLGDLYLRQLNDYVQAERYFLLGIQADPLLAIDYTALFELYRDFYKQNTTAAADILKEGIMRVPGTQMIDLYTLLASYYEDKGDAANAITYYTAARDAAQTAGNTDLVARIDAEIAALKK